MSERCVAQSCVVREVLSVSALSPAYTQYTVFNYRKYRPTAVYRVATHVELGEKPEKSGSFSALREKSAKKEKVRENVFLHVVNYHQYCS